MTQHHAPLALTLCFTLVACGERSPAPPPPSSSASSAASTSAAPSEAALLRVEAAAAKLGVSLKTRLGEALAKGGAGDAVAVCAAEAQVIGASIQKDTGVTVGRSSTKLRNRADAPPAWVGDWLRANEGKKHSEVKGIRAVVDTPQGPMARILKPIGIEAQCLPCHGDPAAIPREVKAVLAAKYPADEATSYHVGDLRGALWAEASAAK